LRKSAYLCSMSRLMKKDIHPQNYRSVVFEDTSAGARFLIASVVHTKEETKWTDGKTYPLFKVEISSATHPFYTGTENILDSAGRVEKFKARAKAKVEKKPKK
jgi:large subunit ribosomal protein L31